MKTLILVISISSLWFLASTDSHGQDSLWQRTYEFSIHNNSDLRNSSTNAIGTYRIINDGFNELVVSRMKPKAANISRGIFNFGTVYLTMLWSHEFGHSIRARQVGGKFNIHNFGLPVPYTTVDLPENISLTNEAIFVTAGFEVNYLNIRRIQSEFIRQNGIWNEDLALSFANRLMYPIYTTFIVPADPEDKNVWVKTAGDPIHYILPVFKNYSNSQVFVQDSVVNPQLVKLYNQATIFAQLINFLDPQFYRDIGAAFGSPDKIRRPIFLIGEYENGWTYGTLFNASPLGYELYMQNYLHLKGRQYGLYLRYGQPFKNQGIGISMNDVIQYRNFQSDLLIEAWQQDLFGSGVSFEMNGRWRINEMLGLNFNMGYKTEGYVLGKQLGQGWNIGTGITVFSNLR